MARIAGPGSSRLLLPVIVAVLLFAFSPVSRVLLTSVDGSFAPASYSSLALGVPSDADTGILAGGPVPVRLTNQTGKSKLYSWKATENGALISLGIKALKSGHSTTIEVPTTGTSSGKLLIAITGTDIFITVPIVKL